MLCTLSTRVQTNRQPPRLDPKRKRFGPPEPLYEVFRNRSETFHFYSFRTRNVPGPFLPISDPFRNISVTCLVSLDSKPGAGMEVKPAPR